jgi:hypothetical protein
MGADHYLYGSRLFIADLVARGHIIRGGVEAARWAIAGKRSFWSSVARDAVLPLLPARLQLRLANRQLKVPDWINPSFVRRLGMDGRLCALRASQAPSGLKFAREMANYMQELTRWLPRAPFEDGIELRYPFLYRPLVELGLQLPPTMRARPLAPKWVLREVMRGILPEAIRTRSGKGGIDARLIWGIRRERKRISGVLDAASLPQLGIVNTRKLEEAIDRAVRGEGAAIVLLLAALSLETWLFARLHRSFVPNAISSVGSAVPYNQDALSA